MTHISTPICSGARQLLRIILEHVTDDRPVPSQSALAGLLGVEKRTIERWVRQLREARLIRTMARRRGILPIAGSVDRQMDRQMRGSVDRQICPLCGSVDRQMDRQIHARPIAQTDESTDPVLHGGGGDHSLDQIPPTPPARRRKISPDEIRTRTGIWMVVEARFSIAAAYELQGLDLADCQADYAARRAAGQGNGAIVQAWRVAPPPSITTAPWSCIAVPDDAGPAADPAASLDGSDDASWTLPQSAAARSRELLRSQLAALAEQAAQAGDDLSADYYRELLQEAA